MQCRRWCLRKPFQSLEWIMCSACICVWKWVNKTFLGPTFENASCIDHRLHLLGVAGHWAPADTFGFWNLPHQNWNFRIAVPALSLFLGLRAHDYPPLLCQCFPRWTCCWSTFLAWTSRISPMLAARKDVRNVWIPGTVSHSFERMERSEPSEHFDCRQDVWLFDHCSMADVSSEQLHFGRWTAWNI